MLEPADLPADLFAAEVSSAWRVHVRQIRFLPVGLDPAACCYRLTLHDGTDRFLKLKSEPFTPASLRVPATLRGAGLPDVVAPIPTRQASLQVALHGGFHAALYPFIAGQPARVAGLCESQWRQLGRTMQQVHARLSDTTLTAIMRREDFVPKEAGLLRALESEVAGARVPVARDSHALRTDLCRFWKSRSSLISTLLRRCEAIGREAAARDPVLVLCHGDIHLDNILVDESGSLHLIDWDDALLAPKERDFMFLLQKNARSRDLPALEAAFVEGYGPVEPEPLLIAWYRYSWVVQELAEFGWQVLRAKGAATETAEDGLRRFKALFDPDDVIDAALRADRVPA